MTNYCIQQIDDALAMIELNANLSVECADLIHANKPDIFSKHQAAYIKAKNEDTTRLVAAIKQLLNESR